MGEDLQQKLDRSDSGYFSALDSQLVKLVATDPGLIRHAVESAKQGMKSPDLFGIFCLTEAGDSERMWTEYADSSCGFVVAFDTTCAAFDRMKQPGRLGKVTYSDEPVGSFLALALEGEAGAIFFRKRLPYSFEREWRSVRAFSRLRLGPGDRYFADFSPECVREILVRPPCAIKGELQELLRADERFRHVRLINGR